MIENARRQKTPNEIALNIVLVAMTALFVLVVFTLPPYAHYNEKAAGQEHVVHLAPGPPVRSSSA